MGASRQDPISRHQGLCGLEAPCGQPYGRSVTFKSPLDGMQYYLGRGGAGAQGVHLHAEPVAVYLPLQVCLNPFEMLYAW